MTKKGLKEQVKCCVNSMLVPYPKGLIIQKFLQEYCDIESEPLPFRELGFPSALEFLKSIPDVVRVSHLPSGHTVLQAVGNQNVSHIQDLVKGQKNNNNASFRVINRILSGQPFFHRNSQNSRNFRYENRTYQARPSSMMPVYHGHYSNGATNNRPPLLKEPVNHQSEPTLLPVANGKPHFQKESGPNSVPPRTCESVELECQLVSEFKNLLLSFPNGVDVSHVYGLYGNTYHKPVLLQHIGADMTSINFFRKHSEVFRLWQTRDTTMVGLTDAHQDCINGTVSPPVQTQPMALNKFSHTGAIPKQKSPLHQPPPLTAQPPPVVVNYNHPPPPLVQPVPFQQSPPRAEVVHHSPPKTAETVLQPSLPLSPLLGTAHQQPPPMTVHQSIQKETPIKAQWVSTDIRTRGPGVPNFQTVTVAWDSSSIRTSKITSIDWKAPSLEDNELPPTFAIATPRVPNVYQPDTKMTRQKFPSGTDNTEFFFIIVAEVYSPGEFYWFLSENRKAIETLTDNMTLFYEVHQDHVISRSEMYVGQFVAAMYSDSLWYRGRIVGCCKELFEVFFLDYGSKILVRLEHLRHLDLHFTQMPIQAFRGRIFGIRPLPHETKWSYEAGQCFLKLIKGSKIIAAAKLAEELLPEPVNEIDTVYSLSLVDTTQDQDIHVNDYLIANGFAAYDPEDQAMLQKFDKLLLTEEPLTAELKACAPSIGTTTPTITSSLSTSLGPQDEPSSPTLILNHKRHIEKFQETVQSVTATTPSALVNHLNPEPARCMVKRIVLTDKREIFTIEVDKELYLSKFDMLMLIPNLERLTESWKMNTDVKVVDFLKYPHIFSDCAKAEAPWIMENGKLLTRLSLYPLNHVTPLFYFLGVKDKPASSAIEAELKEFNHQFTAVR